MKKEILRIKDWESGDISCPRCGKRVTLWFNGGELDHSVCCGLDFQQESRGYDLVVTEKEDDTQRPTDD